MTPPSTPPPSNTPGDDSSNEKLADQAALRVRFANLLIQLHPTLKALDDYCERIEWVASEVKECEDFLSAPKRPAAARAIDQARLDKALAYWKSLPLDPALPKMIQVLPPEVSLAVRAEFATNLRKFRWAVFTETFTTFLCGPVELVMVHFSDPEVYLAYIDAIKYARNKKTIVLPPSCSSFE